MTTLDNSDTEAKLKSFIYQFTSLKHAMNSYSDSDTDLELDSEQNPESQMMSTIIQTICLLMSMNINPQPKPETEFMSLVNRAISAFTSMDMESQPEPLSKLRYFFSQSTSLDNSIYSQSEFMSLIEATMSIWPKPEFMVLFKEISNFALSRKPKTESKLKSLITKLMCSVHISKHQAQAVLSESIGIISAIRSMDLASQRKPKSEFMSLVTQTVFTFDSMDLESQPEPLLELISLITQNIPLVDTTESLARKFYSLVERTLDLEPEPEFISLIYQILSLIVSMCSEWDKYISVSPRVLLRFEQGKVEEVVPLRSNNNWDCLPVKWEKFSSIGSAGTLILFSCKGCNGENHGNYEQAPVKFKHSLHPKHSLRLALLASNGDKKGCYCCGQVLGRDIYYCSACEFAIDFSCLKKPPVLSINHPKWHHHELFLFSRTTSLTCDVCALVDSTCPLYICPPCGFVTHQRCLSLPRVIRISRHPHLISFTHSFDRGVSSCGVCRRKIDNDYGGYSCIKEGCSYGVHSKCATQENVWDEVDLEGVEEEAEEELEPPFVKIREGIIKHFSHDHHLKLDENTGRDYNENQLCQACVTPVHYGNFYSCLECDDFILHEICANLSRKIFTPIHPHLITLVTHVSERFRCSACPWMCTGFFYKCPKEDCRFRLHVQCATVSEPLKHESHHRHPLFLTSKPKERRRCGVCNNTRRFFKDETHSTKTDETFNCIEECDFSLCFACATLPQKVRYKHDKHMLTLSYGEDAGTMTYWCEACEKIINVKERFYKCDEYCCVTLHIECLIEKGLYMKPGASWMTVNGGYRACIIAKANNHRMTRPFCDGCGDGKRRCPYNFYFTNERAGGKSCSITCFESH